MSERLSCKNIATYIVAIIFVLDIFVSNVYAAQNRTQNFLNYKLEKVRYDVPYEVIQNEDGTKTYVVYNYDGDIYEEDEIINSPYEIIKLKEATSSIMRENPYLCDFDEDLSTTKEKEVANLDSPDMVAYIKNYYNKKVATGSRIRQYIYDDVIDKNINYDRENSDIEILKVGEVAADRYFPIVFRKKSVLKIPKEIINSIKKLDILIVFNVPRNDMVPADMWKFRYIEDVYVNKNGDHKIYTDDYRRTTCLELKYQYRYENVKLMKYEYHQANDWSGYAYIDVNHVLDREGLIDRMAGYDIDDADRYIDNLDYKFISDEWMVSYDDGDVDFYLRKWVTYKVNVYKEALENALIEVGDRLKNLHFDAFGYVDKISMF